MASTAANEVYEDQSTIVFADSNWVQAQQPPYIHRNNVLFYFMASPFFNAASRNQEVFMTPQPSFEAHTAIVGQVSTFQREMAKRPGLEFVLAHDPEESNTMIDPPPGQGEAKVRSSLFVIRKQRRLADLRTTVPLGWYFVVGIKVFQAPSVGNVLNARVLAMASGLGKVLEKVEGFGVEKGKNAAAAGDSKVGSPVADVEEMVLDGGEGDVAMLDVGQGKLQKGEEVDNEENDSRTLQQALRLTVQYGKDFADETPLVGEPGNFRLSKTRDQSTAGLAAPSMQLGSSRAGTPAQTRLASASVAPGR